MAGTWASFHVNSLVMLLFCYLLSLTITVSVSMIHVLKVLLSHQSVQYCSSSLRMIHLFKSFVMLLVTMFNIARNHTVSGSEYDSCEYHHRWVLTSVHDGDHVQADDVETLGEGVQDDVSGIVSRVAYVVVDVMCVDTISPDAVLMDHGLDSMTAVILIERLCQEFDVDLDTNVLDACPTVRHLAQRIRQEQSLTNGSEDADDEPAVDRCECVWPPFL